MIIGVLGGGQLGRLLGLAGLPLGMRFRFLDPAADAPAGAVGELLTRPFEPAGLTELMSEVDVLTFETEALPSPALAALSADGRLRPSPRAVAVAQDRLAEKRFLRGLGIPTAAFASVVAEEDLPRALVEVGLPAVMKVRRHGYDGRGQRLIATTGEALEAFRRLGSQPVVLEQRVSFVRELSLIAVRSLAGEIRYYPLVENHHLDGILGWSIAPAEVRPAAQSTAEQYVRQLLEALDYVGVLVLELFDIGDGLLANEIAPRVHNSGHWTIEGAQTSQFENHLRAITGLPLGSTEPLAWSVLINFIGRLPDPREVLALPDTHLHLYGKTPRPGRKLGHATSRVRSAAEVPARLDALRGLSLCPTPTGDGAPFERGEQP